LSIPRSAALVSIREDELAAAYGINPEDRCWPCGGALCSLTGDYGPCLGPPASATCDFQVSISRARIVGGMGNISGVLPVRW
jgi:hypothetical protein